MLAIAGLTQEITVSDAAAVEASAASNVDAVTIIASFPADDYDPAGEWAPPDFDRRHRFLVLGRMSAGRVADLGIGVTMNSGGPTLKRSETTCTTTVVGGRGRSASRATV